MAGGTSTKTSSSAGVKRSRQAYVAQPKPLLRGWFHAAGAVASVIFTIVLVLVTWNDTPRMLSMLVFGLTMVELYTVSAIYHIGKWRPGVHRVLRSVDHSNIFFLIAGTYTPFLFNVLDGWGRVTMLVAVWLVALAGMVVAIFTMKLPRWFNTSLYIGMGWLSLLVMPAYVERLGWGAVAMLVLGGVLYTMGGVIYAMKRPNPFPKVLGFHEVFHLFVIAGSISFAVAICLWVVPVVRR